MTSSISTDLQRAMPLVTEESSSESTLQDKLNPLTSDLKLDSRKVSVLGSKEIASSSTLIKAIKIIAGVLIVSVATAAVVALCLKLLPILILVLTIAGVFYLIKQGTQEKVPAIAKSLQGDTEIDKLLRGEKAVIEEDGSFTPDTFPAMAERAAKNHGVLGAFSDYIPGQLDYPYTVEGVKPLDEEPYTDAIFRHFANKAVGNPDVQGYLKSEGTAQKQARHICGFLRLLGNGNQPVNSSMNGSLMNENVILDTKPLKAGQLLTSCVKQPSGDLFLSYVVSNEEIGLYNIEDFAAGGQPVARFKTSRRVMVSPPDVDGNVKYKITRTFTKI